jgi:hypothetical protein
LGPFRASPKRRGGYLFVVCRVWIWEGGDAVVVGVVVVVDAAMDEAHL